VKGWHRRIRLGVYLEMLIALSFIVIGVLGLAGQKGRKGNKRGLGLMLITIGVIMLALLIEFPHH
jgi:hypothetical protein